MWRRAEANSQRLPGHYQSRFLCGDDPAKSIVLIIETSFWSDCQALSFGSEGTPNLDVSGGLCYVREHPSLWPREGFYITYQHWVTSWQVPREHLRLSVGRLMDWRALLPCDLREGFSRMVYIGGRMMWYRISTVASVKALAALSGAIGWLLMFWLLRRSPSSEDSEIPAGLDGLVRSVYVVTWR